MIKLYFKKLGSMILDIVIFMIVHGMVFNFLYTISNFFVAQNTKSIVWFGIPLIVFLVVIYSLRLRKNEIQYDYLKSNSEQKFSLKSEFEYMRTFVDFRMEILSFATIVLVLIIGVCISNQSAWWENFIAGTVVLCLAVAVYMILDFTLWLFVHIRWKKRS